MLSRVKSMFMEALKKIISFFFLSNHYSNLSVLHFCDHTNDDDEQTRKSMYELYICKKRVERNSLIQNKKEIISCKLIALCSSCNHNNGENVRQSQSVQVFLVGEKISWRRTIFWRYFFYLRQEIAYFLVYKLHNRGMM